MRKNFTLLSLFIFSFVFTFAHSFNTGGPAFIPNKGQLIGTDGNPVDQVLFSADFGAVSLYLQKDRLSYVFQENTREMVQGNEVTQSRFFRVDTRFIGTNPDVELIASDRVGGLRNYYYPHCNDGVLGLKTYQKVTYQGIYPGIDLVVYVKDGGLKYDFVVHPGADASLIAWEYDGLEAIRFHGNGAMEAISEAGSVYENPPVSFQDGKEIPTRYINTHTFDIYGFDLDDSYDPDKGIVIDPSVTFATYFGSSGDEFAKLFPDVDTDPFGYVYIGGNTSGTAFPVTAGAWQSTYGGPTDDAVLAAFYAFGSEKWITYFGGNNFDVISGIDVNDDADIFLCGSTTSTLFPTSSGAFSSTNSGSNDAFLAKFDSSGARTWATLMGGSSIDEGRRVTALASGEVAFLGRTNGTFPVTFGAYQTVNGGGEDVFVAKFSGTGSRQWATFFGGADTDQGRGITSDAAGNIYIGGQTASDVDFPITGSGIFQNTYAGGSFDCFAAKFDNSGSLEWSTYYGGLKSDRCNAVQVDASGSLFLTGQTNSTDFPVTGDASQGLLSGTLDDGMLVKLDNDGGQIYGTYIGGSSSEVMQDIAIGVGGEAYITGNSRSSDYPVTADATQGTFAGGFFDVVISKFSNSGNLDWSSYYGGAASGDFGIGVGTDIYGNFYVVGNTQSTDFPILGSVFQTTYQGGTTDGFIIGFQDCPRLLGSGFPTKDTVKICPAGTATLNAGSLGDTYNWSTGDTIVTSITVSSVGQYKVTVTDTASGCVTIDSVEIAIATGLTAGITADGSTTICDGESVNLIADEGFIFRWYKDGILIGGASDDTLNVSAAGDYILAIEDTCGNSDSLTVPVTVSVTPIPVVDLGSDTTICFGDCITIDGTTTGASYLWCDGSTSATRLFCAPIECWLRVTVAGCSSRDTVEVFRYGYTEPDIGGDAAICEGDTLILDPGSYSSYSWTPGSETSSTLAVTDSGSYEVEVVDSNGCTFTDGPVDISVNPAPTAGYTYIESGLTIIFSNTSSPPLASWDWDFDDGSNSTDQFPSHTFAADGWYYVCLSMEDANGCTDEFCDSIAVGDVAVDPEFQASFAVYPNPTEGEFAIEWQGEGQGAFSIQMIDMLGRVLKTEEVMMPANGKHLIDAADLTKGIYFLRISDKQKDAVIKLIIE